MKNRKNVGFHLSLHTGFDNSRYGNGLPIGIISLNLVEGNPEGDSKLCSDSVSASPDFYYNRLVADETFSLFNWHDADIVRLYDPLGYDRRLMANKRITVKEATAMAKTLNRIERGIEKLQKTGFVDYNNFDGYLRNLLAVMKPAFLEIVIDGSAKMTRPLEGELIMAYLDMRQKIEHHLATARSLHQAQAA